MKLRKHDVKSIAGIAVFIAAALLLACTPKENANAQSTGTSGGSVSQSNTVITEDQWEVSQYSDGTIGITGLKGNVPSNLVIPDTIYGIKVTGVSGFSGKGITSVVFPDTLIYIGGFWGNNLTEVVIPDSVTSIGDYCFSGCGITRVTLGKGIKQIDERAFYNNKLTTVTLPPNITARYGYDAIGRGAFANNQIQTIIFTHGADVKFEIGDEAFTNNQIQTLTIPAGIEKIGYRAFANNKLQSLIITEGVKGIGIEAFADNPLTELVIATSYTSGQGLFKNCPLERITLPANIADSMLLRVRFSFEENFCNFYISQNRAAGTYVKKGPIWTKE
jgi:hypothetical protein